MIIVGASGADARTRDRSRSEHKSLIVTEALVGRNGRARQGKPSLLTAIGIPARESRRGAGGGGGGGRSEKIPAGSGGIPKRIVEALGLFGLITTTLLVGSTVSGRRRLGGEIEVKEAAAAAAATWHLFLRLLLALAGFSTPPSGHSKLIRIWQKRRKKKRG